MSSNNCILVKVLESQPSVSLQIAKICGKRFYVLLSNLNEDKDFHEVIKLFKSKIR